MAKAGVCKIDEDPPNPRVVANRAGFRRGVGEAAEWWVLPETWKEEVCAGMDPTQTARVLAARGMLVPAQRGFATVRRATGRPMRVYVLTSQNPCGRSDE